MALQVLYVLYIIDAALGHFNKSVINLPGQPDRMPEVDFKIFQVAVVHSHQVNSIADVA